MSERNIIIAGWIKVDPDKRDEMVESFRDLVERARNAPGCLDLAITADPVDPARINNFEFWQSQKDLDAWRSVANPPEEVTPMLEVKVRKHVILESGSPF